MSILSFGNKVHDHLYYRTVIQHLKYIDTKPFPYSLSTLHSIWFVFKVIIPVTSILYMHAYAPET